MKKSQYPSGTTRALLFGCVLLLVTVAFTTASMQTVFKEGFEAGSKTSYAAADVVLGSGSWFMDDALIGNLADDKKMGLFSIRMRNTGQVRMNFNRAGAGTVSIQHAVFGSDRPSSWQFLVSTNDGNTWTQVGPTVTTSTAALQTATFKVNNPSAIRFAIKKVSGGANQINLDNLQIGSFIPAHAALHNLGSPQPATANARPALRGEHLTMGNPSSAVTSMSQPANYLVEKKQYAMSYNRDKGEANWVSWHLDSTWLGSVPRQNDFRVDLDLPLGWYQVKATDYARSGFDRGHMCPSADRTVTISANSATFLMSNMIPQLPANNRSVWADLEGYCRTLVFQGNELYIVSGGLGVQAFIADGHVAVPGQTWKVIMVLPNGNNDIARVTTTTRTIAVVVPNSGSIHSDWRNYRVSVDQVEAATGLDFFANVPAGIQAAIEGTVDNQ